MDELERAGLARRERAAHDRRAYAIELTDEGRRRARASAETAAAVGARLFGVLAPGDRARLVELLTGIADRATGISTGGDTSTGGETISP
jgi:DNA-binding MarR family transcriptional regulator